MLHTVRSRLGPGLAAAGAGRGQSFLLLWLLRWYEAGQATVRRHEARSTKHEQKFGFDELLVDHSQRASLPFIIAANLQQRLSQAVWFILLLRGFLVLRYCSGVLAPWPDSWDFEDGLPAALNHCGRGEGKPLLMTAGPCLQTPALHR